VGTKNRGIVAENSDDATMTMKSARVYDEFVAKALYVIASQPTAGVAIRATSSQQLEILSR
jgi:hypothetical protein